ncbi:Pyruvate/Phosphoenolpyruvate kinase-like domain-containing protein [Irpex rosettiformis]|uniref:Pyruvate/Phosphoenolpyruvate kinase-like domain-containing protein n=1 Tax=Irpex rosettiformis TaxID=378272 RepID=A0ACB8TXQ6_9APHY|nr:Pyruvate/Phosphoenolpyruvate kinase-like domain-containing protein [Irpex rosettiformis]
MLKPRVASTTLSYGSIARGAHYSKHAPKTNLLARKYSASSSDTPKPTSTLRRSWLYVPASSDKMLRKSLTSDSDVIIYDLEDSVPPSKADKINARNRLARFIQSTPAAELPQHERLSVRVNSVTTPFYSEDISQVVQLHPIHTLVLPKIHSAKDLDTISSAIFAALWNGISGRDPNMPISLVASIESAKALYNIGEIASWKSTFGPIPGGQLTALLFAAEDYCADTSIVRTPSRQELLFTRSQIAITAKAFGLDAIDMVCVNYRDTEYLKDECADGRRLGYTGKQAIHPGQVNLILSTFVPSQYEILRAARILHQMERAYGEERGAFGLATEDGGKEMIDAPMLKQAENTIRLAQAANLEIPKVD